MLIRSTDLPLNASYSNAANSLGSLSPLQPPAASPLPPSTITSIQGTAQTMAAVTYEGPARTAAQPLQVWSSRSDDSLSQLMARNFSANGDANRLNGLGSALLERFTSGATHFKQVVAWQRPAAQPRRSTSCHKPPSAA